MLKAIARIVLLSHPKSPGETVDHPSLGVVQRRSLTAVQGLFAFQMSNYHY
jgi:hypothetical protein